MSPRWSVGGCCGSASAVWGLARLILAIPRHCRTKVAPQPLQHLNSRSSISASIQPIYTRQSYEYLHRALLSKSQNAWGGGTTTSASDLGGGICSRIRTQ
eukprot:scaffold3364_cov186-Alexandrium_tamarense.AAC.7